MKSCALFGSVLGLLLVAGAADAVSYDLHMVDSQFNAYRCANYRLTRQGGPELLLQCLEGSTYVTYLTIVDATCPKTSWVGSSVDGNGNFTITCKGARLTR